MIRMANFKKVRYGKSAIENIPEKQGVYVINGIFKIGRPDYIGKSSNLRRRVKEHLDKGIGDFLGLKTLEYTEVRNEEKNSKLERELIREKKPRLNKIRYKKD